jgi:hypothetical protein
MVNMNKTNMNHLSHQIIEHTKRSRHNEVGNIGPILGHTQSCGIVKLVIRIPFLIIGNPNVCLKKKKLKCYVSR